MPKKKKVLTIYEELGMDAGVTAVVERLYEKVVADPRIAHFFTGVDMKRQIEMQKKFLTMVFGGPAAYTGRELAATHSHLVHRGLDHEHVDALLENMGTAMRELGVRPALTVRVLALTNSYREEVLSKA